MSPANLKRRERARDHRAAVEAAILDSAGALLAEAPYRELTVEDVMAPTGLGRTAFYRYFTDLDAMLLRRLTQIEGELYEVTRDWIEARGEPREDMLTTTTSLARLFRDHGPLLGAIADSATRGPELEHAWRATVQRFIAPTLSRIKAWIAEGAVELEDPDEAAKALIWMTERYLLESYRERSDLPIEVAADTLATIWWRVLFPNLA
jgi:AcrR family transcriptional regulator